MNILIAGDYCPRYRLQSVVDRGGFADLFSEVKTIVDQADFSIVNLECPVVNGKGTPIKKCGPNLRTTEKGVEALKWVGFDCVTLANNHFYDYGDEGVRDTLQACHKLDIDYVGGGMNITEASQIFYKEINGQRLAVINCCEHEFSIATDTSGGSNPLDPIQQYYAIKEAKDNADYVLVIVHGGHEHWQLPSPRMVETYRFFIDAGADAVVNHHQHCFSGYEVYNGKPIFYGLGNFCFDINPAKRDNIWNYGFIVKIVFDKDGIGYEIFPYEQCGEKVGVMLLPKDAFDGKIQVINDIIYNKIALDEETQKYYEKTAQYYGDIFEPVNNRIYLGCKSRGWLPSLVSEKRRLTATNFICCEAHRDKLIHYFISAH